jgi:hypothetical protein
MSVSLPACISATATGWVFVELDIARLPHEICRETPNFVNTLTHVLAREPTRAPRQITWRKQSCQKCEPAPEFNVKYPQLHSYHHMSSLDVRIVCPRPKWITSADKRMCRASCKKTHKSVTRQQRMGEQSRLSTWPDVNVLKSVDKIWHFIWPPDYV